MATPPKSLLLVTSQPDLGTELESIFTDLNYRVMVLASASEVPEALKKAVPSMVLASMDGKAKGGDACKALKESSRTSKVPVLLMTASTDADKLIADHKKGKGKADAYIRFPAPLEDVVDCVEHLVGLPPPPNGRHPASAAPAESEASAQEVAQLKKELEELQEQLHFYQKQLDQVSVAGERETREMDQLLKDLQEEVDTAGKEKEKLREEIHLLKGEIAQKDREVKEKEVGLGDLHEEMQKQKAELERQLEEVRAVVADKEDKHKRAQNALREYYKPKVSKVAKLERTVSALEDELVKLSAEVKARRDEIVSMEGEKKKLHDEIKKEREKNDKIKAALEQTRKLME